MNKWQALWQRILSVETARFILALLALNFAAASVLLLLTGTASIDPDKESVVTFALGQLFALAMLAFNRYFGSSSEEQASGKAEDPLHVEGELSRPRIPPVGFGREEI